MSDSAEQLDCPEPDSELLAELERRMSEMDIGAVTGVPMEEVFERLRKKHE